jgi:hypothetical protein
VQVSVVDQVTPELTLEFAGIVYKALLLAAEDKMEEVGEVPTLLEPTDVEFPAA